MQTTTNSIKIKNNSMESYVQWCKEHNLKHYKIESIIAYDKFRGFVNKYSRPCEVAK